MANEEDYGPGPDDGIHDPGDYKPAPTGLVLTGDVAALRREVRVLRTLNATLQAENTRLRQALQAARLPHSATCPAYTDATLPCGCRASQHNAAIDAVLTPDP